MFEATIARNSLFCALLVLLAFCLVLVATPAMANDADDNARLCTRLGITDELVGSGKPFGKTEFANVLKMKWKKAEPELEQAFTQIKKDGFWKKNKADLKKNWKPQ